MFLKCFLKCSYFEESLKQKISESRCRGKSTCASGRMPWRWQWDDEAMSC